MSLLAEYKNSLKLAEVEEPLDLVLYRPPAFLLVKAIYRLPITPNQVTFFSLLAGLASAWCFARGTVPSFVFAGIWYAVANVLDCADGMLARLQNSGSPFGRLVDGIVDWVTSVAIFIGVGIGLTAITGNPMMWWVAAAGGFTSAFHAIVFDSQQQAYIAAIRGKENFLGSELERAREELNATGTARVWVGKRLALRFYLAYMHVQKTSRLSPAPGPSASPEVYRRFNLTAMRWWTLLGATTNRSGLIVAALFGRPDLFCWIVAIAGNLYLMFMLLWQRRIRRRMARSLDRDSQGGQGSVNREYTLSAMGSGYDQDLSR
ncbi:MAG TPA: CDP-alcohol phosphatidyltransferase family protein [Bacteroidota bacterium]|nr:CDP-alcohol phosphatidyltransferase family protein [Bacteroidota bacterium]